MKVRDPLLFSIKLLIIKIKIDFEESGVTLEKVLIKARCSGNVLTVANNPGCKEVVMSSEK